MTTTANTKRIPITRRRESDVLAGVSALLGLFDDPDRPGVQETPLRVLKMYREMLTPQPFTFTLFDAEGADQMVIERDIPFCSLCEHHLLPFIGTATVAYIPRPDGKIAGLSKLARAVDYHARSLQTQERLTNAIATYLQEQLDAQGVGVVLHAEHLCMTVRGVQKPGTMTTTSALLGNFRSGETRSEFLALAYTPASGGRR